MKCPLCPLHLHDVGELQDHYFDFHPEVIEEVNRELNQIAEAEAENRESDRLDKAWEMCQDWAA